MDQLATKSRGEVALSLIAALAEGNSNDLQQMGTRLAFNAKVLTALNNIATKAAGEYATAEAVKPLLQQIKAAQPVDRYVGSVVASTLTQVQGGAARNTQQMTVDRWGNVLSISDLRDPNWKVSYTYNYDNQLISQTLNALAGTSVAASKTGYDALGRKVSNTDFNNNTSTFGYDSNGRVALETHADGGTVAYAYNLFGDRTSVHTARGFGQLELVNNYAYDHLGHITTSWTGNSVDIYVAMEAGQRYMYAKKHTNGQLWEQFQFDALGRSILAFDGSGNHTATGYDLDGNVISVTDYDGNKTLSSYDAFHHKTATLDANGNRLNWTVDVHGRVSKQDNAGSAGAGAVAFSTNYSYDAAGRRLRQWADQGANAGQNINYSYTNGLLTRITDNATGLITSYSYDKVGNRLTEQQSYVPGTANQAPTLQNNTLTYDMQNRLTGIKDNGYTLTYHYDDNGNRTRIETAYAGQSAPQVTVNSYDSMNRQLTANFEWVGDAKTGYAIRGSIGHTITYDLAGNRLSDTYAGTNLTGQGDTTTETYGYDLVGRLSEIRRENFLIDTRRYDQAGRLTESGLITNDDNTARTLEAAGISTQRHIYSYTIHGRLNAQRDNSFVRDYAFTTEFNHNETGLIKNTWIGRENYDKVGNLLRYTVSPAGTAPGNNPTFTVTNRYTDSYQETTVYEKQGNATNTSHYDVNGNRTSLTQAGKSTPLAQYWYDADGHVQSKTDTTNHFNLIVNGQVMGEENKDAKNVLGSMYTGVTSAELSAPPSSYSVQGGETLQSIAQTVWGDSKLWYLIADANALDSSVQLEPGRILRIPARVNTVHNDYATYKPYNASEAIGNTAPAVPPPGQGGGCGAAGKLIMAVVAVAVAYFTAGAASGAIFSAINGATATLSAATAATMSGAFSIVAGGAIAGAAGSIASQLVGNAIGAQDGFSWRSVGMAAIGGAVTAGVGEYMGAGQFAAAKDMSWSQVAARAAVSNTITQGIGNIAGLQHGFSWASVAASAAGGAVGSQLGSYLETNGIFSALGNATAIGLARATTSGFAAGLTAAAMRGGKIAVTQIATDAFGNALGSSLAAEFSRPSLPDSMGGLPSDQRRHIQDLAMRTSADLSNPDMADRIQKISELKFDAGQGLSRDDVLGRTNDFLRLRGATDDQILEFGDIYAGHKVLPLVGNVEARWPRPESSAQVGTFVGKYVDNSMVGTGEILSEVGAFVESKPAVQLMLEGLDIVTGPAAYALRKFTPVGDALEAAQGKVTSRIADGLEGVGRSQVDAMNGGVGGTALLMAGVTGLSSAVRGMWNVLSDFRTARTAAYNARSVGNALESQYPGQVTSSTLARATEKNVSLAGQRHPVSGIVFDTRGFPIFDDIAAFDTKIGHQYSTVENSAAHMRAATRDLREAIQRGGINSMNFTEQQIRAINGGKANIPDLTWHHHQDIGRMQLIPTTVHQQTGHVGGFEMWFR